MRPQELVESAARVRSNWSDSEGTVWPTFDAVSSCENMCFADLLALADDAYLNSTAIHPGTNNGVKNPFNPISRLQVDPLPSSTNMLSSCHNFSLEQTSIITINDNPGEPQGAHTVTPPTADEAMRGESSQVAGVQINLIEEEDVPSTELDNNETPNNQELSEPVIESSVAADSTPLKKNHNPDMGGSGIGLNQTPLPEESSQNVSNGSSSGNLTTRLHMGVTKRKHSASSAHAGASSMNLNEIVFPHVRKKRKNKTSGESGQVVGMQVYSNRTCFSELLQPANSIMLHEVNSQRKLLENSKNAFDLSIGMKDATNHMT